MSKLSYYHADVSRNVKIGKYRSFFKMTVTFDLNKIFKFCFNILYFFKEYKYLPQNGAPKIS